MPYKADQATIQRYIDRSRAEGVSDADISEYLRTQAPQDVRDFYGKTTQLYDLAGTRPPTAGPAPAVAEQPSWPRYLMREGEIGLGNFAAGLAGIPARLGAPTPSTAQIASSFPTPATPGEHALAAGAQSAGVASPLMLLGPQIGVPAVVGAGLGAGIQEEVQQQPPFKSEAANQALALGGGLLAGGGAAGTIGRLTGMASAAAPSAAVSAARHGAFGTMVGELSEVALRHFGLGPGLSQIASLPIGVMAAMMGRGGSMPFSNLGAAAGLTGALLQGPAPSVPGTPLSNPLAPNPVR